MRENVSNERNVIQEIPLDHWKKFPGLISEKFIDAPAFIFRGQADASWDLTSTLDRLEQKHPTHYGIKPNGEKQVFNDPPLTREEQLSAFRLAIIGRHANNSQSLTENDFWAIAQHHGLATPLMDFTFSPFIALFFAFHEKKVFRDRVVSNIEARQSQDENDRNTGTNRIEFAEPDERIIYALSISVFAENDSRDENNPTLVHPKEQTSPRLLSQSGVFVKKPKDVRIEDFIVKKFPNVNPRHPSFYLKKLSLKTKTELAA
ncbi:MAG: FRG domain-containing protein [bacterium]|nr:FRG domain-containing protein [bacterium]